jgi:hypothetical protein
MQSRPDRNGAFPFLKYGGFFVDLLSAGKMNWPGLNERI